MPDYEPERRKREKRRSEMPKRNAKEKSAKEIWKLGPHAYAGDTRYSRVDKQLLIDFVKNFLLQGLRSRMRERQRRKVDLSNRKSAASQARMKNIANLASEEKISRKKRKATSG
jgi:actin-related protein 5